MAQARAVGTTAVLAATITVKNGPAVPGVRADGLLHGLSDQFAAQVLGRRPADNPASAKVDDHGEVEPSAPTGDKRALPVLEWVEIEPSEEEEDANAVVLKGAEAACGRLDGLDG